MTPTKKSDEFVTYMEFTAEGLDGMISMLQHARSLFDSASIEAHEKGWVMLAADHDARREAADKLVKGLRQKKFNQKVERMAAKDIKWPPPEGDPSYAGYKYTGEASLLKI